MTKYIALFTTYRVLSARISGDASPLAQHKLKEQNVELVTRTAPMVLR